MGNILIENGKAVGVIAGKNDLEWKYLGTESGTNEITLPADYNELYFVVGRSSSQYGDCASCFITKSSVNTSGNTSRSLTISFGNATGKSYVIASYVIITSTGKIKVDNIAVIYSDGTVQYVTSNAHIWVYYR